MRGALLELLAHARMLRDTAPAAAPELTTRIPVPYRDRIELVEVAAIAWIEAAGDYACLHAGGERHLVRESLSDLERHLGEGFVRIHRSALVRRDAVVRLAARTHGDYDVTLIDGTRLRLTRQHRAAFARAMGMEL
jgi:two-component system LytT family response regulator